MSYHTCVKHRTSHTLAYSKGHGFKTNVHNVRHRVGTQDRVTRFAHNKHAASFCLLIRLSTGHAKDSDRRLVIVVRQAAHLRSKAS